MSTGTSWQGSSRELLHACLAFNGSRHSCCPTRCEGNSWLGFAECVKPPKACLTVWDSLCIGSHITWTA